MPFEIINCVQGEPDWFRARMGIPTASEFATVLAPRAGKEGKMRLTYLRKLAGEIVTGEPMEGYSNAHMDRGKAMEEEARDCYAFMADVEPERVGFIRCASGKKGCSPDSLIGASGVLEIKTALPHILIDRLVRDEPPPEHKAQCQGNLWIAEREWIDLALYWPKLPLFVKRVYRDDDYIRQLAEAVEIFNTELDATVRYVRSYGLAREAA